MRRAGYIQGSAQDVRRLGCNHNKENEGGSLANGKAKFDLSKLNEINELFKLPSHDSLHVRRETLSSFMGQTKRIQSGTMENKPKSVQHSMSFRSCSGFIHPNTNPRRNQSRRELIKKMVILTECALKSNNEIKHSTPVKVLSGLTPKRTPRSYLVLPELQRKVQNIDEMRTPLKDFIKQETVFGSSVKKNSALVKADIIHPLVPTKIDDNFNDSNKISEHEFIYVEDKVDVSQILEEFQKFNAQISKLHEEQRVVEDEFETKIKELPVYAIYEEFCRYQAKKQELSNKMKSVEDELSSAIKNQRNVHENVNCYIKANRKLLDEGIKLHTEFEMVVQSAMKNCKSDEKLNKRKNGSGKKNVSIAAEKPQLRRSLRLSKIPIRIDPEEVSKKRNLLKLNNKSKVIKKTRKSPRCKNGKVLAL